MHTTTPRSSTPTLALLALGVVYGDIGTSPLYAVKETFNPDHGIPLTAENVLGGLSAIFWALMIVVSLKYVLLVLRASNRGEGGIMALLALAAGGLGERSRGRPRRALAVAPVGSRRRRVWRGALLRRCRAHAGHLGAFRRRRPGSRDLRIQAVRRAARRGHPDRSVPDPEARHRFRGPPFRSGVRAVVRVARGGRRVEHCQAARDPGGARPAPRVQFRNRARLRLVRRARRGAARDHRRRSALCRHGAFRQARHPPGMVRPGGPGAGAELFRPGRTADRASQGTGEPVLYLVCRLLLETNGRASDPRQQHPLS